MTLWRPSASLAALRARAESLGRIRAFFAERGVLEVQTPLLGRATVTDPDVQGVGVPGYGYLQTSPEYFMKRLIAAGLGDCYQLASAFRHEERGRLHNVEFTLLEWYRLGYDDKQLMLEVAQLCDVLLGAQPFQTLKFVDLVGEDLNLPRDELDLRFAQAGAALSQGRFFITEFPADQAALSRLSTERPNVATRFELVIDGVEIANGYWELTDAQEHQRRFAQDLEICRRRGLPTPEVDHALLGALQAGLPDCAGVAIGVDRLMMLALGATSLDDVLAFRE